MTEHTICLAEISIHAPVKGATRNCWSEHQPLRISIHAPVKGATAIGITYGITFIISIHAPVKGATGRLHKYEELDTTFQSTLPRRERPIDDCARAHERRRQVSPSSARANTIP